MTAQSSSARTNVSYRPRAYRAIDQAETSNSPVRGAATERVPLARDTSRAWVWASARCRSPAAARRTTASASATRTGILAAVDESGGLVGCSLAPALEAKGPKVATACVGVCFAQTGAKWRAPPMALQIRFFQTISRPCSRALITHHMLHS